jgi:hypothetical protein
MLEVGSESEFECEKQLKSFFEEHSIAVGDRRAIKNYVITVQEGERIANVAKRYIQLVNMLSTDNVILAFVYQDKFWNAIDEQTDNLQCTICEAPAKKLRKCSILQQLQFCCASQIDFNPFFKIR